MLKRTLANFKHYYDARGREEIKSIMLTFWSGFIVTFGALFLPVILELTYGEWTRVSEVLTVSTIITALIRSLGGAVLYAVWPDRFKFKVTGTK